MDIMQSPAGQIIKFPSGYKAFIPNPLPPTFEWNNQIVNALSRADFLLGKLAREGSKLPNPHLYKSLRKRKLLKKPIVENETKFIVL